MRFENALTYSQTCGDVVGVGSGTKTLYRCVNGIVEKTVFPFNDYFDNWYAGKEQTTRQGNHSFADLIKSIGKERLTHYFTVRVEQTAKFYNEFFKNFGEFEIIEKHGPFPLPRYIRLAPTFKTSVKMIWVEFTPLTSETFLCLVDGENNERYAKVQTGIVGLERKMMKTLLSQIKAGRLENFNLLKPEIITDISPIVDSLNNNCNGYQFEVDTTARSQKPHSAVIRMTNRNACTKNVTLEYEKSGQVVNWFMIREMSERFEIRKMKNVFDYKDVTGLIDVLPYSAKVEL